MLFNSFSFFVFFPVVTSLYFLLPHKYRWALLLGASCLFYMAFIPYYILILFLTIGIDYFAGIKIEQSTGSRKKWYLIISIVSTCLVLIIFKYYNFFGANIQAIADFFHWNYSVKLLSIILPIGLSFHTFQSLSYVIEVYRGNQKAEYNFSIYSLYVMFYPQLVAGPIERPQNLLHQFYEKHLLDFNRISEGLKMMLFGFFKKMVIADNLAMYVNEVYGKVNLYDGHTLLLATFFFSIQIYCDFSGYSDIAIGSAKVMGFKLMDNFKNPYMSLSIGEFWKRWHISLSTWFRDYVYIPLGGNRVSTFRLYFNLVFTFALSGFWHGANWTFIIWGLIHGLSLAGSNLIEKFVKINFSTYIKRISVLVVVFVSWIFFRANNLNEAFYIVKKSFISIFAFNLNINNILLPLYNYTSRTGIYLVFLICLTLVLSAIEVVDYKYGLLKRINKSRPWIRYAIYVIAVLSIMNLGVTQEIKFIYFQF